MMCLDLFREHINTVTYFTNLAHKVTSLLNNQPDDEIIYSYVYMLSISIDGLRTSLSNVKSFNNGDYDDKVKIASDKCDEACAIINKAIDSIRTMDKYLPELSPKFNYEYTKIYYKCKDSYNSSVDIIREELNAFSDSAPTMRNDEIIAKYLHIHDKVVDLTKRTNGINESIMELNTSITVDGHIPDDCSPVVRTFLEMINSTPQLFAAELDEIYAKYKK